MASTADKAVLLRSLHVPGNPLIVTNVWDGATARAVAAVPGVRALATASHAVSEAHGVADGEGLTVDQALDAARIIVRSVELPVSVDFERGYSVDAAGVESNVRRLAEVGAAGLNFEDSVSDTAMRPLTEQLERIAAVIAGSAAAAVPLSLNARVDALRRGEDFAQAIERGNAYLAAGATSVFVLGLSSPELVAKAVAEIDGPVAVIAQHGYLPLTQLADLGVARVSVGPGSQALTLTHLAAAAAVLTGRGGYPQELRF
ncbi:isocitrate lyase/phosphoenolpyruvate mutase family protein [soil metagenome]